MWDVHDQSTSLLMRHFYREFMETGNMADANQYAMQEFRQQDSRPYFWIPFVLVGKFTDSTKPI